MENSKELSVKELMHYINQYFITNCGDPACSACSNNRAIIAEIERRLDIEWNSRTTITEVKDND